VAYRHAPCHTHESVNAPDPGDGAPGTSRSGLGGASDDPFPNHTSVCVRSFGDPPATGGMVTGGRPAMGAGGGGFPTGGTGRGGSFGGGGFGGSGVIKLIINSLLGSDCSVISTETAVTTAYHGPGPVSRNDAQETSVTIVGMASMMAVCRLFNGVSAIG
jgi:hypothetical protein